MKPTSRIHKRSVHGYRDLIPLALWPPAASVFNLKHLSAIVFFSAKDFSFLRSGLFFGAWIALVLIIVSVVSGFTLGIVFSTAMIVLASGFVLYYTSRVLRDYRVNQHVAASLALFAAVTLLYWYVLRFLLQVLEYLPFDF